MFLPELCELKFGYALTRGKDNRKPSMRRPTDG